MNLKQNALWRLAVLAVLFAAMSLSCVADPCDGAPDCDPLVLPW